MPEITTIEELPLNVPFMWVPSAWYGPAKLISKEPIEECKIEAGRPVFKKAFYIQLAVAMYNDRPSSKYIVRSDTRVQLL